MKINLKNFTKKYLPQIIVSAVILIILLVSIFFFIFTGKTVRRQFLFPSADDNSLVLEYRNLPKEPTQGDLQMFVEEVLLGSGVERTKMVFALGTKVLSCFEKDKTLYLNLSSDLLFPDKRVVPLEEGAEILKKNIKMNFPSIKKIEIYVEGNLAFEK